MISHYRCVSSGTQFVGYEKTSLTERVVRLAQREGIGLATETIRRVQQKKFKTAQIFPYGLKEKILFNLDI